MTEYIVEHRIGKVWFQSGTAEESLSEALFVAKREAERGMTVHFVDAEDHLNVAWE